MPVVMLSGHATIETAVEATRIGAFDFLEKPIGLQSCCRPYSARSRWARPNAPAPSILLTLAKARSSTNCALASKHWSTSAHGVADRRSGRRLYRVCAGIARTQYTLAGAGKWSAPDQQPLEILESARGGTLYCPEVAHLSRSEQRSLAFMLGKTGTYGVRIVCAAASHWGSFRARSL